LRPRGRPGLRHAEHAGRRRSGDNENPAAHYSVCGLLAVKIGPAVCAGSVEVEGDSGI